MTSLEETQEKFDFLYTNFEGIWQGLVTSILGSVNGRVKLGDSFEVVYDAICQYPVLDTTRDLLIEGGFAPFTEEDLRTLYEYFKGKNKRPGEDSNL